MGEDGADAGFLQRVDRAFGLFQRGEVVAPVQHRGDAAVDLGQRADQIAEVVVLRLIERRDIAVDVGVVVRPHPFRADAAQAALPDMDMSVDEAGHHDHLGGVDHLVGGGIQVAAYAQDLLALDQDLGVLEVADLLVHRHGPAGLDQCAGHVCLQSSFIRSCANG
jgi:hypothetical protein